MTEPNASPQEPAPVVEPAPAAEPASSAPPGAPDEIAAVRELILRAYPDVVPELVRGATIAELQGTIEPARAAYRQVAERIASAQAAPASPATPPSPVVPPVVPAGAAVVPVDLDGLPASELIKRGLAQATSRRGRHGGVAS